MQNAPPHQDLAVVTVVNDGGDALGPKNHYIGSVSIVTATVYLVSRRPKITVFTRYLTVGARITVFTVFVGQNRARTLVFTQFQQVARNKFSMQQTSNTVNYSVWGLILRVGGEGALK